MAISSTKNAKIAIKKATIEIIAVKEFGLDHFLLPIFLSNRLVSLSIKINTLLQNKLSSLRVCHRLRKLRLHNLLQS